MHCDMCQRLYGSYSLFGHGLTLSERDKFRFNKAKIVNKKSVGKVKMPLCWLRLVWIILSGHFSLYKTTMGV